MGRKRKSEFGSDIISISVPKEVLRAIDKKATAEGRSRSDFISVILKHHIFNDLEYNRLLARHHHRKFQFYIAEVNQLEKEKEMGL